MKKRSIIFCFVLTALLVAFIAVGCTPDDTNGPGGENTGEPFFDCSDLNYNPFYSNPNDPSEKGYILYDRFDVSGITFTQKARSSAYFILKSGGTELTRIDQGAGGVYTDYELTTLGDITVEVYLPADGKTLTGEFVIKVAAGGFPTAVEYEFLDSQSSQPVAELTGGMTIKVAAKVYSGSELLSADSDLYTSGWQAIFVDGKVVYSGSGNSLNGNRTVEVTLPNLEADAEIHCNYQYKIAGKELPVANAFAADVLNNMNEFVFHWGLQTENGEVTSSPAYPDIFSKVTSHIQFKNGDITNVGWAYRSQSKDGDLVPFIRYDGEGEFAPYEGTAFADAASLYNSVTDLYTVTRYLNNGVSYRFNPSANYAEIYLARRYSEKIELVNYTRYRKLDASDLKINFVKDAPEGIDVPVINGKELRRLSSHPWESIVTITNRPVANGGSTAKVFVKNTKTSSNNATSKQYFFPEIAFTGDSYFIDYYVRFDSRQVLLANNSEFFSETAGDAVIEIVSCANPDVRFILTVTFENPVIETTLKYSGDNKLVYLRFDPTPYCSVEEEFYNYDVVTRSLKATEEIRVYDGKGSTYRDYSYFTANTKKYCATNNLSYNYSLRLFENGAQKGNSKIIEFYVAPDYYVEVNGVKRRLCEITSIFSRHTEYFTMYAALIQLSDGAEPVINVYTREGDDYLPAGEEIRVYNAVYNGNWHVEYRGFIADGEQRKVDLCVIKPAAAS